MLLIRLIFTKSNTVPSVSSSLSPFKAMNFAVKYWNIGNHDTWSHSLHDCLIIAPISIASRYNIPIVLLTIATKSHNICKIIKILAWFCKLHYRPVYICNWRIQHLPHMFSSFSSNTPPTLLSIRGPYI